MFKHILFPVDFSGRSRAVMPLVRAMAQRFQSKITLLNVVQIPTSGGFDGGFPIMFDPREMEECARQEMETFFDGGCGKVVAMGDPAFEIIDFAELNRVDLIMMPTHGYGKFRRFLLGSVTAKVLHDAKCPVWTAAHTEDPDVAKHLDCRNIMGAIDLTDAAMPLIRQYVDLARHFDAKLRLVHAVPGAGDDVLGVDRDFKSFLLRAAHEEAMRLQAKAGTNLEVCMEGGAVSKVVREAALHHDADLILLGRGALHQVFGQLRTNAYAIIRDAPCPVLTT